MKSKEYSMQISFEAEKLKKANAYVNLLNASSPLKREKIKNKKSLLKKIFNFLFR
ncbi:MAG: Unknown protein [uncultured Sulfurovum sp.]|uniref:Uncharacterized protein n=1 Tax=uncultured Sulfurovum sp. TaxID=269237 RepID=A0A6S6T2Y4_9BACT|nr:MAG: Unknown protein [uncultured Sulfurovum sp.]